MLDEDRWFGLTVWYDESARSNPKVINQTILDTPSGRKVALGQVAEVLDTTGPNTLNRENVQRRLVIFCNVQGRDLGSVVTDIKASLAPVKEQLRSLPGSYRLEYGGQFEAQQQATSRLGILAVFALIVVFLLLWKCLDSDRHPRRHNGCGASNETSVMRCLARWSTQSFWPRPVMAPLSAWRAPGRRLFRMAAATRSWPWRRVAPTGAGKLTTCLVS